LCCDLGNGQVKAEQAARAVDGLVAVPDFGDEGPDGATDFNDFVRYRGLEAARACIANSKAPAMEELQKVRLCVGRR
jgi:putative DNA primase/helicase